MKKITSSLFGVLEIALLLVACNNPAQLNPSTQTDQSTTPRPDSGSREHRIAIRQVNGVGEFYDRLTAEKFVPRGNNYVQLGPQRRADGGTQIYHAVFDPGTYDRARIASALEQMHAQGYNVVRVFLSQNTIGTTDAGLDPAYMDNVVDFLRLAKEYELYVIPTVDWLPGGKYGALLNRDCCETFTMMNVNFLTPGGLAANEAFFQDFARYLLDHDAPMDALLAYELRNELFFDTNFPPLSLTTGVLTTVNGKSYDMSDLASKKRMLDENLVYWIDQMRAAILEVDPTALVAVGFFAPQEPNASRLGDPRYATTHAAIRESSADFIDLHPYPAAELNLKQYVENFGMDGMQLKPIIIGEFGVIRSAASNEQAAAQMLMDWQIESCKYGFDGWLLWDWNASEVAEFYNPMSGNGEINAVLSPLNRPDPCQAAQFDFIEKNIARGAQMTASASLNDQPPTNVVDGTPAPWNSGAGPVQWIQIDLGKPFTIKEIRLSVAQYPDGNTTHEIWVRGPNEELHLVKTFTGNTTDNQSLSFIPDTPLTVIQIIRIKTTSSPSWVAWKEIEVFAP